MPHQRYSGAGGARAFLLGRQFPLDELFPRLADAHLSRAAFEEAYTERLRASGYPDITTEIAPAGPFYYAEDYHQQYLHKNPWGYCGLGGTGVACPVGVGVASADVGVAAPAD